MCGQISPLRWPVRGPQRCPTREGWVALVPCLQHGGLNAHNPTDIVPDRDPRLSAGWPRACCQGGMRFPTFILDLPFVPPQPLPLSHICSDLPFSLL